MITAAKALRANLYEVRAAHSCCLRHTWLQFLKKAGDMSLNQIIIGNLYEFFLKITENKRKLLKIWQSALQMSILGRIRTLLGAVHSN